MAVGRTCWSVRGRARRSDRMCPQCIASLLTNSTVVLGMVASAGVAVKKIRVKKCKENQDDK
jgi:hypothetical protein